MSIKQQECPILDMTITQSSCCPQMCCQSGVCIADLPHCVNALWLLIEGIGITAGGGAKINGYNNNE